MRLRCPYCEKTFAVYPIPTGQAARHRRAGMTAWLLSLALAAVVYAAIGPDAMAPPVMWLLTLFPPRLGTGVAAALLVAPVIFFALGIYDRAVPHFGRPVGDDLHCLKCGYVLKGLREPRCPECGQAI